MAKTTQARNAPLLQIGSKNVGTEQRVAGILERVALRAVELGREVVAVEAVKALSDIGAVKNVSITHSMFQG